MCIIYAMCPIKIGCSGNVCILLFCMSSSGNGVDGTGTAACVPEYNASKPKKGVSLLYVAYNKHDQSDLEFFESFFFYVV